MTDNVNYIIFKLSNNPENGSILSLFDNDGVERKPITYKMLMGIQRKMINTFLTRGNAYTFSNKEIIDELPFIRDIPDSRERDLILRVISDFNKILLEKNVPDNLMTKNLIVI